MYSFHSRVRYTELNHYKGKMGISSIINYFQDCSTFQSEDLNLGISYLNNHKRSWLLNSWQVQINRYANLGEQISIGTWAYGFKGIYGYRNFVMLDAKNEVIVAANSVWVYMNSETGRPTRVPNENLGYELEPAYDMNYADRKIEIPTGLKQYQSFPVVRSNIDSYNHVNNGQYIKMAEEYLPDTFDVDQFRVEYKISAVLGDIIVPKVSFNNNHCTVVLCGLNNNTYAIVDFTGTNKI